MSNASSSTATPRSIDNTDWLKTVAIILVAVDHFGYFFVEDADWWSVFGRLAAPPFFFLMGYAKTRKVPFNWIWLGVLLTLLDSWNNGGAWVAPNILLSFALIRIARPYVQSFLQRNVWAAFAFLVAALLAVLPKASEIVDYGSEGWLWALFGMFQRMYVDGKATRDVQGMAPGSVPPAQAVTGRVGPMRVLTCFVAVALYVWQEQMEFSFAQTHFAVFFLGVGVLSLALGLFSRGPSRIQPPELIAGVLRFIGRHTLEIYAIQLAGSEIILLLLPDLAP